MSNLNQEYDKKKEQLKEGAKDIKNSITGHLSDAGSAAWDKASDAVDTIKDKSQDIAENVRDKATDANKEILGFVRERPYIALASALVAGWVIAKVLL
jgi:ElaB/YqjD/DUF883 family membrane-anchored ribosome-binding protein